MRKFARIKFNKRCKVECFIILLGFFFLTMGRGIMSQTSDISPSLTALSVKNELPLKGKRICIDPGHGGEESGAVGVGGLRESDVNLRVALFLKEMLEKAGATVLMTRTEDKTVSITERWKFNRENNTDLFVSIHHNANAQIDRSVNRTEVFYHWNDEGGPSEDAARAVLREMQARFLLPDSKVYMCWAYGVLRENSYPAILGELSYISNPEEEKRLRNENYNRAEAEAYFKGILNFFRDGRPEVKFTRQFQINNLRFVQITVSAAENDALIDPQRFKIELDGVPLTSFFYDKETNNLFIQIPADNSKQLINLRVGARNLAGHTSTILNYELNLAEKLAEVERKPVLYEKKVTIFAKSEENLSSKPIPQALLIGKEMINGLALTDDSGVAKIVLEKNTTDTIVVTKPGYWRKQTTTEAANEILLQPLFRGVLHNKVIVLDPEGGGDNPVAIGPNGLRAADTNLITAHYLADYLQQAGARVSLTRTIDKSMDNVARARFGLERNPDVFLTIGHRLPEPGLNEKTRMNVSRIGHRWDSGGEIARSLIFHLRHLLETGAELGDVTSREPLPGEIHNWSSWEVMHAAQRYTAVYVCLLMFDAPGVAERLATTAGCRKEALALLYGLIQSFGLDDRKMTQIEGIVRDAETKTPLADVLIWLDDTLVAQTEANGKYIFKYLESGQHNLQFVCKGYSILRHSLILKDTEHHSLDITLTPVKSN